MMTVRSLYGKLFIAFFNPVFLLFTGNVQAAEEISENVINETLVVSLQPIVNFFAGNAWLQGIVVMLVTFMAVLLVTWLLFKILGKIAAYTKVKIDDEIISLLKPPIYYMFLTGGISYGLVLIPLSDSFHQSAGHLVKSIGVIIWITCLIRLAPLLLENLASSKNKFSFIQHRTMTLFENVAKILIFSIGIHAFFVVWRIDMTAWLASAGIVGIAVGFAAKDTLSNLFSGVFILADAPYKVGDYVVLDGGERGRVIHIGLRSTRILTRDDVEITIPNSIIGNNTIVNQSGGPSKNMRIRVQVGVAYGSSIDQVREILLEIAKQEPEVCTSPEPTVRFRCFGPSSLDFEVRCWISRPEHNALVLDKLNSEVYKAFNKFDIEIPYAKQDLYIKGLPESFGMPVVENMTSSVDEKTDVKEQY